MNEVWADTMAITVASVLSELPQGSWLTPRVEVLVETQSLSRAHWSSVCRGMKTVLERHVSEDLGQEASVEVELVPKSLERTDWRRRGTDLAHWVAKLPEFVGPASSRPLYARLDLSGEVEAILDQSRHVLAPGT